MTLISKWKQNEVPWPSVIWQRRSGHSCDVFHLKGSEGWITRLSRVWSGVYRIPSQKYVLIVVYSHQKGIGYNVTGNKVGVEPCWTMLNHVEPWPTTRAGASDSSILPESVESPTLGTPKLTGAGWVSSHITCWCVFKKKWRIYIYIYILYIYIYTYKCIYIYALYIYICTIYIYICTIYIYIYALYIYIIIIHMCVYIPQMVTE